MNFLILNRCFYPDVAATGQYASDLAVRLVERGHTVTILTGRRGYDDPQQQFDAQESWKGVTILRVPHTAFGKGAPWRRIADFASFYASCAWKLVRMQRFDTVVAMTTPPLVSWLAARFVRWKGGRLYLWVMDLNPDQAIEAGWLNRASRTARILEAQLAESLRCATRIVVLDRFMRGRILVRGVPAKKVVVCPPWSLDDTVSFDEAGRAAFRREHGLEGRFVVMYSGNHSPCHPLETLLDAARLLSHRQDITFCFVGGGSEHGRIRSLARAQSLDNVICLPYQSLHRLSASLSAADLHVVVMGDPYVGIVHPCKIYNVLRLGIPFLYIGPEESHVTDMLPHGSVGCWAHLFGHGQAEAVAQRIEECAEQGFRRYEDETLLAQRFSSGGLASSLVKVLEGRGCSAMDATPGDEPTSMVG